MGLGGTKRGRRKTQKLHACDTRRRTVAIVWLWLIIAVIVEVYCGVK